MSVTVTSGREEMSQGQRKILVIGAEAWVRDTVRVLLGSMGCLCVTASGIRQALALLEQERPDAAIVDEQGAEVGESELSGIEELCQHLRDRVIFLTGESRNPGARGSTRGWWLPQVSRVRLVQDLWGVLNSVLRPYGVLHRVTQVARLIFDSLLEPAPVGIRGCQGAERRFVYEAGNLMLDLSLEPQAGSSRVILVGQLMDGAKPDRQLENLRIVLLGPKGQIVSGTTGKFGEFHLDFNQEPDIKLEIETATNEFVSVNLPRLVRVEHRRAGAGSAGD